MKEYVIDVNINIDKDFFITNDNIFKYIGEYTDDVYIDKNGYEFAIKFTNKDKDICIKQVKFYLANILCNFHFNPTYYYEMNNWYNFIDNAIRELDAFSLGNELYYYYKKWIYDMECEIFIVGDIIKKGN